MKEENKTAFCINNTPRIPEGKQQRTIKTTRKL